MAAAVRMRCCQSQPRCSACPIQFGEELRELRDVGLGVQSPEVPSYLTGLPECLHKYGPLFDRQLRAAEAAETSST